MSSPPLQSSCRWRRRSRWWGGRGGAPLHLLETVEGEMEEVEEGWVQQRRRSSVEVEVWQRGVHAGVEAADGLHVEGVQGAGRGPGE